MILFRPRAKVRDGQKAAVKKYGAYLGEALRKECAAVWHTRTGDAAAELPFLNLGIALVFPHHMIEAVLEAKFSLWVNEPNLQPQLLNSSTPADAGKRNGLTPCYAVPVTLINRPCSGPCPTTQDWQSTSISIALWR